MNVFARTFRTSNWWNYKLPPLFAISYLTILTLDILWLPTFKILGLLLVWMIGAAGFGYYLNDCCDIEQDLKAGKANSASGHSIWLRFVILLLLLGIVYTPWFTIGSPTGLVLVSLQLLLFVLYSVPPLRFKERGAAGIILDGAYAHLLPALIVISAFGNPVQTVPLVLVILIVLWQMGVGFKNIFLHQVEDKENDIRANVETLAVTSSIESIVKKVKAWHLLEVICFIVLTVYIFMNEIMIAAVLVAIFFTLKVFRYRYFHPDFFNDWKLKMYFSNDFYDEDLPVIFLITLSINDPMFLALLFVHLCLFPNFYSRIIKDLKGGK